GLFIVGFVAGVLLRRYGLAAPFIGIVVLLITASVLTWMRIGSDGPNPAIAIHLITLYSWVWLGALLIEIALGYVENEVRENHRISSALG
ncbi:hypothetical protein PNP85_07900, partial [Halobacterium salinarum]|uniref:hypothetical protein n=1 Tax=Halobacterium salinarum TaxID=2242 RepID=UPI002556D7E4